jgi:CRP-like cAMP-binding protein
MIGLKSLRKAPLSSRLVALIGDKYTRTELEAIERFGTGTSISAGDIFVTEGQIGREVILITSGTAAVARDGEEVASVGAGDFVGERAIILGEPRNASLVATTDLEVLVYSIAEFRSLLASSSTLAIKLRTLVDTRN